MVELRQILAGNEEIGCGQQCAGGGRVSTTRYFCWIAKGLDAGNVINNK